MKTAYVIAFRAMGCQVNVWLETAEDGAEILRQVPEWIENLEAQLSRFRQDSELSRLNAHVGQSVEVSDVLLANIIAAKQGARRTDGLYNPLTLTALINAGYDHSFEQIQSSTGKVKTNPVPDWHAIDINPMKRTVCVPAPIDLGGIAKGWSANYIANRLAGYGSCVVDMGGDIVIHDPDSEWGREIVVDQPGIKTQAMLKVSLKKGSIVTSGIDYRRWHKDGQLQHHLIDPRTGLPAQTDVVSATVIHSHAPTAEVYAKAILMLGSQAGLAWINQQWEHAALVVRNDGAVLATDSFQKFILEGAIV